MYIYVYICIYTYIYDSLLLVYIYDFFTTSILLIYTCYSCSRSTRQQKSGGGKAALKLKCQCT